MSTTTVETTTNGGPNPWWLRSITTLGVPAALCIFLVWWITGEQARKTNDIISSMNAHISQSGAANAEVAFYMRAMCVAITKGETACIPPRPKD